MSYLPVKSKQAPNYKSKNRRGAPREEHPAERLPEDKPRRAIGEALDKAIYADSTALCDVEAERAVLGAVLLWPNMADLLADLRLEKHFWNPSHAMIWHAILTVKNSANPIDIVSVSRALTDAARLNAVGGIQYLGTLSDCVVSSTHVEHYARLVVAMSERRALISAASELRRAAIAGDQAGIERAIAQCSEIRAGVSSKLDQPTDMESALIASLEATAEAMEALANGQRPATEGRRTGIDPIDAQLPGGLVNGDTIVVAGGTGAGKSLITQQMARTTLGDCPEEIVIIASLEMKKSTLAERELSAIASEMPVDDGYGRSVHVAVPQHVFRTGAMTELQSRAFEGILRADLSAYRRLHLLDDFSMGIDGLRAAVAAKRARTKRKVALVVIDYLQLLAPDDDSLVGADAVANVSRQCKMLAHAEDCIVALVSQFSRKYGDGERPRLSHLKGGSAIEQDASAVMLLHRPDLKASKTIVYMDKTRHCAPFETELIFAGEQGRFVWAMDDSRASNDAGF